MDGMPRLLPLDDLPRSVLVVAPHADDEVLGCGGAVAQHAARGDAVRVLVLTAAEGEPRLEEARAGARVLGVAEVEGLGCTDGAVGREHGLVQRLQERLEGIDLLYAPAPSETHPDHRATAMACAAAAAPRADLRVLAYGVNRAPLANRLLDITPVAERKDQALAAHRSQAASLGQRALDADRAAAADVDLPGVERVEAFVDLDGPGFARFARETAALLQHTQAGVRSGAAGDGPRVTAVISTWNKAGDVCANLDGLRAQVRPFDEVVVVDNASTDDTADRIRAGYPEVTLVVMPHDRFGACETFNLGFRTATGDLIAILDDDVVLTPSWLEQALERLRQEPASTAIVSTMIEEPGMPEGYLRAERARGERYMSTFRGCASLARRADILEAGGYDERLFIYGNERDLTCRLLARGKRVLQFPGAVAFHRTPFGMQMGKRSLYYHARNAWLSMLKHAPLGDLLRMPFLVVTRVLLRGRAAEEAGEVGDAVGTIGLGRSLRETPGALGILARAGLSVLWNIPYCLRRREVVRHPDFELPLR
jgi:GT2 family glycosyltransferase/LmbE family N-acetylglucosaminyl deacetylase